MKIIIIGYSGSGKSTLAKRLSDIYNLKILYLDNVKHYGNWSVRSNEEIDLITRKFLAENSDWIIDGNYLKTAPERFEMADLLIYLDYNRFYCYRKAKQRYKEEVLNGARESCCCPPKFNWEFKVWLLFDGRKRKRRKRIEEVFDKFKVNKIRFRNVKQLELYLKDFKV